MVVLVLGLSAALLRGPSPGSQVPPDLAALEASLQGIWDTPYISRDDWLAAVRGHGFDEADVTTFLEHNPIPRTSIGYELRVPWPGAFGVMRFDENNYLGGGKRWVYSLLPDGRLQWTITHPGASPGDGCVFTAGFTVSGDTLEFAPVEADGCSIDEQILGFVLHNLAPYHRI